MNDREQGQAEDANTPGTERDTVIDCELGQAERAATHCTARKIGKAYCAPSRCTKKKVSSMYIETIMMCRPAVPHVPKPNMPPFTPR